MPKISRHSYDIAVVAVRRDRRSGVSVLKLYRPCLKRSFFSTAAALFCFTTLLNDNRRTKGAKSLSLHSRSKEKIIALKLAPRKCTLLSQKSERKNANCCCLVGSFCSFEVRLNLYLWIVNGPIRIT